MKVCLDICFSLNDYDDAVAVEVAATGDGSDIAVVVAAMGDVVFDISGGAAGALCKTNAS